jgi:hypothetical protein
VGSIKPSSLAEELKTYHTNRIGGLPKPVDFEFKTFHISELRRAADQRHESPSLLAWIHHKCEAYRHGHGEVQAVTNMLGNHPLGPCMADILANGVHLEMHDDFQRNEGSNKDLSPLYMESTESRNKVHHGFVEDYELGRVLVLPWDDVTEEEKKLFHVSKVTLAPKPGAFLGRTCANFSSRTRRVPSLNESIDIDRSQRRYPKVRLPTIRTVADMFVAKREATLTGEALHIALCDVSSAYKTLSMDAESACLQSIFLLIDADLPGDPPVLCVAIFLTNIWGNKIAGDAYGVPSVMFKEIYDGLIGWGPLGSSMYVDDHALCEVASLIDERLKLAASLPVSILGPRSIDLAGGKIYVAGASGDIIGFTCNLETFTISPKRKALIKLYYLLFWVLPSNVCDLGATVYVPTKRLLSLAGVLMFYSAGIPASSGFMSPIYKTINRNPTHWQSLISDRAKNALVFWRGVIFMAVRHMGGFARRIETMVTNPVVTRRITSDASSLVGGGAYLSKWDESQSSWRVPRSIGEWRQLLNEGHDPTITYTCTWHDLPVHLHPDGVCTHSNHGISSKDVGSGRGTWLPNMAVPCSFESQRDVDLMTRTSTDLAHNDPSVEKALLPATKGNGPCPDDSVSMATVWECNPGELTDSLRDLSEPGGEPVCDLLLKRDECGENGCDLADVALADAFGPAHLSPGVTPCTGNRSGGGFQRRIPELTYEGPTCLSETPVDLGDDVLTRKVTSTINDDQPDDPDLDEATDEYFIDAGFVRWTEAELSMFEECEVNINILEYFVACLFVVRWVDQLAGQVVELRIDNTTAVSWINHQRAKSRGGEIAESLAKIMTLFCYRHGVVTTSSHIPGIINVFSDCLSRDLSLQEEKGGTRTHSSDSLGARRLRTARGILMELSKLPPAVPLQTLLEIVERLQ